MELIGRIGTVFKERLPDLVASVVRELGAAMKLAQALQVMKWTEMLGVFEFAETRGGNAMQARKVDGSLTGRIAAGQTPVAAGVAVLFGPQASRWLCGARNCNGRPTVSSDPITRREGPETYLRVAVFWIRPRLPVDRDEPGTNASETADTEVFVREITPFEERRTIPEKCTT